MDDGESRTAEFVPAGKSSTRTRSGSASSHKRSLSGSLFSRFPFFRMTQTEQSGLGSRTMEQDGDNEGPVSSNTTPRAIDPTSHGKAMSAAMQHQRRTRRRRGSLRKTALLGTRLESRDKRALGKSADSNRAQSNATGTSLPPPRIPIDQTSPSEHAFESTKGGNFTDGPSDTAQPSWRGVDALLKPRTSVARRRQELAQQQQQYTHNALLSEETGTDEEDLVSFPHINTANNPSDSTDSVLRIPTPSSSSESFFPLNADANYRPVHRAKSSPLATHSMEMQSSAGIAWDYSETEWWGWIILMVTWLVFVVGMGSCFEVWSWAWDVGETPYAPPELEDDPTLPIVGYYPALIILTAVMSWVWVIIAWVGMKYFKHANISGDDS
ncbi:hypothetical protein N7468_007436 [Penicillium chermesinum]|uniref:Uncharacterized protein n=1 Tax=Penicillium chermesinum TaxID=63820 RepID=A0A9W9NUV2_9EURO|nr:uncharacterized protein N7468_007436 [Penicillium chermesinum]KAJ5226211.1 hypothetical protein N7468_007436 [Penicillium chermesinum]KAJ6160603.1 hypothetical protein N7470_003999 [Penicillium chermesinum]